MIPKIIHYCWFGRAPLPALAQRCILSWKKFLPDYKIKEWNEDNFDVNMIPYTAEAYKEKKYAFVSDFVRLWVLYNYGGLYFDTDVEVIKPMDEIIARGPFMGCEKEAGKGATTLGVAPGLGLGVNPGLGLYRKLIETYKTDHFINLDGTHNRTTIVTRTSQLLYNEGLQNKDEIQLVGGIYVYPKEYFCPMDYSTGKIEITENTYCIHHYAASWKKPWETWEMELCKALGMKNHYYTTRIYKKYQKIRKKLGM